MDAVVDHKAETSARNTRDRIVAAAFRRFVQNGYEGTGLSLILKDTGLSKGAFYHHFATKEELYREVVEAFFLKPMHAFDFAEIGKLPLKDTRAYIAEAYEQLPRAAEAAGVDLARYFALFFESLGRLEDFRDAVRTYYDTLLQALAQKAYEEAEIFPKVAGAHARNLIVGLEGRMFLRAVFGEAGPPEFEPAKADKQDDEEAFSADADEDEADN